MKCSRGALPQSLPYVLLLYLLFAVPPVTLPYLYLSLPCPYQTLPYRRDLSPARDASKRVAATYVTYVTYVAYVTHVADRDLSPAADASKRATLTAQDIESFARPLIVSSYADFREERALLRSGMHIGLFWGLM